MLFLAEYYVSLSYRKILGQEAECGGGGNVGGWFTARVAAQGRWLEDVTGINRLAI
jgi:hypothetical protein